MAVATVSPCQRPHPTGVLKSGRRNTRFSERRVKIRRSKNPNQVQQRIPAGSRAQVRASERGMKEKE